MRTRAEGTATLVLTPEEAVTLRSLLAAVVGPTDSARAYLDPIWRALMNANVPFCSNLHDTIKTPYGSKALIEEQVQKF